MNRIFHKSCFFICWQYGNIVWHHVSDQTFTNTQMILFPPHFSVSYSYFLDQVGGSNHVSM